MPNDYCVNQVKFGNTMVMDISDTTASPEDVAEGEIFYAANGARSVGTGAGGSYVLPIASANTLGGIKVGDNLSIDNNGVLSATNNGGANAIGLNQSEYDALPVSEKTDPDKIYFVGEEAGKFNPVVWSGLTEFYGSNIWTDGTNTYYSNGTEQYKLNGTTWESIVWTGLTNFEGIYIWSDNNNTYYSNGSSHYKLNGVNWESMTWTGLTTFDGYNIWTDGTNIYYSNGEFSRQYKLNGTTWESISWSGLPYFDGNNVWSDGTYIYCSEYSDQYKLNGTTWEPIIWTGLNRFFGIHIWSDGTNTYYSDYEDQYKLNGTTWEAITWDNIQYLMGEDIWTNGTNIYYSDSIGNYRLNTAETADGIYYKNKNYISGGGGTTYTAGDGIDIENTTISLDIDYLTASRLGVISTTEKGTNNGVATLDNSGKVPSSQLPTMGSLEAIDISQSSYDVLPSTDKNDPLKIYFVGENDGKYMTPMSWGGSVDTYGNNIWSDGTNIYYSGGVDQYKLNGTIWEPITWTGLTDFYGNGVWTDGIDIYYSNGTNQRKLNNTTWETVTWTGLTSFNGGDIWSDGTNIYYSSYVTQYKLNGTTWESVTWNIGFINGYNIWSDGNNIYLSQNGNQYKLNGTTWESVTWIGLTSFEGQYVWTDGINIYYSAGSDQYKLNNTTWESITWVGLTSFDGKGIWTDGNNTYYSSYTDQYKVANSYSADGIYYKDNNYVKPAYELPIASGYTLGGVMVGSGLSIDSYGVLSSIGGGGGSYTAGDGIDIENTTISLDIDYLTASRLGVVSANEKGNINGVATLDSYGRVPSSQLPSYVDDVLEYADLSSFPVTGESGKIYVALDTNKTYRWSGSTYVEINSGLALGETTGTAYEGNKGKANADNIATIQGVIPSNATTSNKLATASDIPDLTNYVQKSSTSGFLKNDGTVDTNTYLSQVPVATENILGGIKVGTGLSIDSSGVLSANGGGSGTLNAVELAQAAYDILPSSDKKDLTKIYFVDNSYNRKSMTWNYNGISAADIWTDGTNIYYSRYNNQYKLNGTTWEATTWSGIAGGFEGKYIWTDGTNIYYSYSSDQYKLNGTTWSAITWSGLNSFNANYIWTDGVNIYLSRGGSNQYKLNGTTWESITWSGTTNYLYGDYVWTDGTNIYYSSGSAYHYKLNNTTWESVTFDGLSSFSAAYIWTYKTDVYFSSSSNQYKLNGTTWEPIVWNGGNPSGNNIWVNNNDIYESGGLYTQFKLIISNNKHIYYDDKNYTNNDLELPIASASELGGIKVGSGLSIDSSTGVLSASGGGSYTLPTASTTTKGGVKIGNGLQVSNEVLKLGPVHSKASTTAITLTHTSRGINAQNQFGIEATLTDSTWIDRLRRGYVCGIQTDGAYNGAAVGNFIIPIITDIQYLSDSTTSVTFCISLFNISPTYIEIPANSIKISITYWGD